MCGAIFWERCHIFSATTNTDRLLSHEINVIQHNRQFDAIVCRGVKVFGMASFLAQTLPDIILIVARPFTKSVII